jgi:hypothetical protein
VPTSIAVTGIRDERGAGGGRQEQQLRSRLLTAGAVVSGRVLQADGQAVPDAVVTYMNSTSGHDSGRWDCRVSSESAVAATALGRCRPLHFPIRTAGRLRRALPARDRRSDDGSRAWHEELRPPRRSAPHARPRADRTRPSRRDGQPDRRCAGTGCTRPRRERDRLADRRRDHYGRPVADMRFRA